jgi:molecular chaperone HtpG
MVPLKQMTGSMPWRDPEGRIRIIEPTKRNASNQAMNMEKGTISVSTENIFPIIKKSLYSDHEIFLRELVSNAVDATQKLKRLSRMGEFTGELGDLKITVKVDKEAKTITIDDHGIGMNEEEVKKYLNQVAFSGAEEFIKRYKDAGDANELIGKFGLGFYSAFMVAHKVEVISHSFQESAEPIHWTNDGTTTYTLEPGEREARGSTVILHVADDSDEFLETARIKELLRKYCRFLPVEIEFEGEVINNPDPIWRKAPTELEDEQYQTFFRDLYPFDEEPLFWIHLNVDYPFNLTGILYFPKIRQDIDPRKNKIQLYSRQVFITDEVSQIVPDYLMLLQGVIDSPDIPLNVSRSYLQSDRSVKQISSYITRKVADKLKEIFNEDRPRYEEKWGDISVFVKYGYLTDDKFREKATDLILISNIDGNHFTLAEYRDKIAPQQTDKDGNVVYLYTSHAKNQDLYIKAAEAKGYDVVLMDGILDTHFVSRLESEEENIRFVRVDSDTVDKLVPKDEEAADEGLVLTEEQEGTIKEAFVHAKGERQDLQIQTAKLGAAQLPVSITRPEFMRRMKEQSAMGGTAMFGGDFPEQFNLVVNVQHPVVMALIESDQRNDQAKQLLDLALLSQGLLVGSDLTSFITRSVDLMQ